MSVAAGGYGSAVVRHDQSIATWGSNAYGSLGLGSTTDALVPTAVSGLTSVAGLSPGAVTSLALRADGSVWAWGNNNTGAVGDGTTITPRTSPQAVPDLNRGSTPLATYAYGGDGLRASKTVAGQTRAMAWDESAGLPLLVSDGERSYLYGASGTPYAQVDAAGTITYLHADHLGSVRALTDAAGSTVGTATFDPYGTLTGTTGATTTPFGFAGEYTDAETGFVYLRARYYDPATGQFLTRDPLEAITQSAYGYASNNPLNFTDPTGLAPWDGVVDFFTGGDCGDGFFDRALGGLDEFVWTYRDEITFGFALVGTASCPMCTAAFYASMGLSAVSTVQACNSGDGTSCALGLAALATGGSGRALSRGAAPRLGAAADVRLGASRWHPIQRNVTGPILRAGETAARRTGFWSGWTSNALSGIDVVNG